MSFELPKPGARAAEFSLLLAKAVGVIGDLTKRVTGTNKLDKALDTITIIKVLLDQLTGAYSGAVSVKEVDAALDDFQTAIKNNDADADEKLRKKFTQG